MLEEITISGHSYLVGCCHTCNVEAVGGYWDAAFRCAGCVLTHSWIACASDAMQVWISGQYADAAREFVTLRRLHTLFEKSWTPEQQQQLVGMLA